MTRNDNTPDRADVGAGLVPAPGASSQGFPRPFRPTGRRSRFTKRRSPFAPAARFWRRVGEGLGMRAQESTSTLIPLSLQIWPQLLSLMPIGLGLSLP